MVQCTVLMCSLWKYCLKSFAQAFSWAMLAWKRKNPRNFWNTWKIFQPERKHCIYRELTEKPKKPQTMMSCKNYLRRCLEKIWDKKSQDNACVWLAQLFPSPKKETIYSMQKVLKTFKEKIWPKLKYLGVFIDIRWQGKENL